MTTFADIPGVLARGDQGSDIVVRTVHCAALSQEKPLPHAPAAQGTVRTTFADIIVRPHSLGSADDDDDPCSPRLAGTSAMLAGLMSMGTSVMARGRPWGSPGAVTKGLPVALAFARSGEA